MIFIFPARTIRLRYHEPCHSVPALARLMMDRFFVILILPLALLSKESQKTQDKGYPVEGVQGIFSANVIHSFRITAFLFPKKEQLLSESVFPSSGIILFRELRLSHVGLS